MMGLSKLIRSISPYFSKRNKKVKQSACGDYVPAQHLHIRSPFRSSLVAEQLDAFLDTKTIHVSIDEYIKDGQVSSDCPIYRVHASQLAANIPIEDRWNIGFIRTNDKLSKLICSVMDGHSGPSCSHALAWIVHEYIAAALSGQEDIMTILKRIAQSNENWIVEQPALRNHKGKDVTKRFMQNRLPPPDVRASLVERLITYMTELSASRDSQKECLEEALLRLDSDLCSLGLEEKSGDSENPFKATSKPLSLEMLRVAQSGSVGVFGILDWSKRDGVVELQIANVGDCAAVLFSVSGSSRELEPTQLSKAHNGSSNEEEIERIKAEHPEDTPTELIRNGQRLLGELAPTRAFGDVRYKWPAQRLQQLAEFCGAAPAPQSPKTAQHRQEGDSAKVEGSEERSSEQEGESSKKAAKTGSWSAADVLPTPYSSPPYLTAKPEVTKFVIKPTDRYLVLATDGLWDTLHPEMAAFVLSQLQPGQCPATRLVRAALSVPIGMVVGDSPMPLCASSSSSGRTSTAAKVMKEEPRLASALLSLPPGVARLYRDDVTIVVVELNASLQS